MDIEELRKTNEEMRNHTKEIKQTTIDMNDKSSLMFGVRSMEKMINTLDINNADDITNSVISKYLFAEDYKKLLLAEIDVIQAFENLQKVYIDTINIAKDNHKNSKEDNSENEEIGELSDVLMKFIEKVLEEK